jgi:hypothetical protein
VSGFVGVNKGGTLCHHIMVLGIKFKMQQDAVLAQLQYWHNLQLQLYQPFTQNKPNCLAATGSVSVTS